MKPKNKSNPRDLIEQLKRLLSEIEQAQAKRAELLRELLAAAKAEPANWTLRIEKAGKEIVNAPLEPQTADVLSSILGPGPWLPGGQIVCYDKVGCVNLGAYADHCVYVCYRITAEV